MKKRILVLCAGDNGTIGMCSLNLYKALKTYSEFDVKCAFFHHFNNALEGFVDAEYFESSNSLSARVSLFDQIKWLERLKAEHNPDITISTLFSVSTLSVLSGGSDFKIGIFHSPHQQVKAKGRLQYIATLLQYKFLYPKLDVLSCVSAEVKNSIIKGFPNIDANKIKVIYNVHLIEDIIDKSIESLDCSEEDDIFGMDVILYCGRLDKNKAPDRLLRAYIESKTKYHLVYMGLDEGMIEPIKQLAKEAGVLDYIHYIGPKKNPYKYITRAKMLVSSSYSEGLPGVIIEALVLGVPVVSTNSTYGLWEIFCCTDKYDKKLRLNLVTSDGIITPNTGDDKYDDTMLARAIAEFATQNIPVTFAFKDKVTPESIVKQYLDHYE